MVHHFPLPESLEVEHSFISSFYRQLLDRSDHVGKVIAPVQGLVVDAQIAVLAKQNQELCHRVAVLSGGGAAVKIISGANAAQDERQTTVVAT